MNKTKVTCGMDPERCSEVLTAIYVEVSALRRDYMKVFIGLLSVTAASVGVKYLGTPFYVHLMGFMVWGSGVFLLGTTVLFRKNLNFSSIILRITFSAFMLFSIVSRTFFFRAGIEAAPVYFTNGINTFFIIISVILIVFGIKTGGKRSDLNSYDKPG